ncbi:pentatricopeptide repeat-containing protein chloroplastic-like [Dorcoceras hygrometricum]|uniref:Pentatricopeptide repeat-containing protein chloroplastic-like n=1 Tax=Dorcoceras hygrometricum TaxID=472368 RepID=A0A2Z7CNU6_9LAMI|nr:pentatricopeptide repeat-containing protein chloroplastic-like [Dorcoceras hygrometricum]
MASLKLSPIVDNNSYEPNKICLSLKSLKFNSISSFSGYVSMHGALIGNPFGKPKHCRVSGVRSEYSYRYESKMDPGVDSLEKCSENDDIGVGSPYICRNTHKGRFNDSKRLQDAKIANKRTKGMPGIRRNRRGYKLVEKPLVFDEQNDSASVLGSTVVDFDYVGHELSLEHCNAILKQLEEDNDIKALRFFEWMRVNGKLKHNLIACNIFLRVLGRKEDWNGAESMIKGMVKEYDCELDCQSFNTLLYASCKKGLVDLSTRWFQMMLDYKVQPNIATFGMLMSLYQKGGFVEEAEFTFSQMRNLKLPCQSAYSAMITIYTRMRLYDKAEDVVGFLREDELVLNFENWLVMLNAYCQQGKLNDAEKVLSEMRDAGFSPNIIAYNTMITGYGKASKMDEAELLFQNLRKLGLEPDETTYKSLIEGWGRAGNYKQAKLKYMELTMLGFKPNSSNFYTLVNLQAKHEDDEGSKQNIYDMMMIGYQKSSILGVVINAYEKANRLDKMSSILEGSLYDHVLKNQTSCAILVTAFVKNCLIDDAIKVLRDKQWEDPLFEDHLYHLLICSCKDMGHHEDAITLFTCLRKYGVLNLNIFCTMIDIYSSMSMFSEAERLYAELKTSGVQLDMIAFSIIIRMYVKSGSLKGACAVLDEMKEQKNIVPDVYLLRDMLRIYQRCGMNDKLVDLYYKGLKNGRIWDEEMYNCVINCCANALPVDELSRLFDEMLHQGFAPNNITFNVMLNAYGKFRLFEKARKVFWMAKKRGLVDVVSYNTIIAAYGKNKYFKNMSAVVRRMQFDGFSVSLEAYNCMLDVYGKEGEMEKFRNILHRLKDSSHASDHYTYNILINIYGEHGWIEEVSGVLMELKESGIGPDLCGYNTLIKAYGIAGMVEDAVVLVKEMRENGIVPDRITYTNLIAALRKNDKVLEAVKWSLWMKQMGI